MNLQITKEKRLGIIGSGPMAIYLLKHVYDRIDTLKQEIDSISIFERSENMGMGMPYTPETTDVYNLSNISSEEIPELFETFGNWLRNQKRSVLESLNITEFPIRDSEVYSRLSLGRYFQSQYVLVIKKLKAQGITVIEYPRNKVVDIIPNAADGRVRVLDQYDTEHTLDKVVIATGHQWKHEQKGKLGYFSSPWPIHKILPEQDAHYDFTIGILGASLSAFDVVTSLSHRHGKFIKRDDKLIFKLNPNSPNFKIVLHSAEGWLPHLQYEQRKSMREIYRHTSRKQMLALIDDSGFMSIETYFNVVCKPALKTALIEDKLEDVANKVDNPDFLFIDFVETMSQRHEYNNSFEGMKKEMITAKDSVENNKPIHWKETLDDLMYSLNFHAELLTAEDHLFFRKKVMSFLMNVIAAMPLPSANILLALYDSGCIDLIGGKVKILNSDSEFETTKIEVKGLDGEISSMEYKMFIECGGDKNIELSDFPFPSLISGGNVREARAKFSSQKASEVVEENLSKGKVFSQNGRSYLYTGGIEVDAAYRIIDVYGDFNNQINDIAFTHTLGVRPYSYGLQACSATSEILTDFWASMISPSFLSEVDIQKTTYLYEKNDNL
ncbi:FAD/NAD(P)-binding protein [Zobellia laminariae]|uniref:FAD/NAD(P)-binding protein n=1 Tax=Zobellia laminariae TaxID=248906 RepID=UPI003EF8BD9E